MASNAAEEVKLDQDLLDMIMHCDGAEIHRDDWEAAEALQRANKITLGGARGPNGDFRRAEIWDEEEV